MSKSKLIKVWTINTNGIRDGYFSEDPKFFLGDLEAMDEGDEFVIKVQYFTKKQIESAPEFGGW